MTNLVTGLIGVVLVSVFLGFYAVGMRSLPFTIIVVAVSGMVVADFVQSVKNEKNRNGP